MNEFLFVLGAILFFKAVRWMYRASNEWEKRLADERWRNHVL